MSYQEQEPQSFSIFEVDCIVTPAQSNEVWCAICESVDGIRFHQVELLLDKVHWNASDPVARECAESLCFEHANLRVRLAAAARDKLRELGVMA